MCNNSKVSTTVSMRNKNRNGSFLSVHIFICFASFYFTSFSHLVFNGSYQWKNGWTEVLQWS